VVTTPVDSPGGPSGVAVHQIVPSLQPRDATGSHTLRLQRALRTAGYASLVFAERIDPELDAYALPVGQLEGHAAPDRTVLLYQLSVGSDVVDRLLKRPEPLVVYHHNVTPAQSFWPWAPEWLLSAELGHRQVVGLRDRTDHAIAASTFSANQLRRLGYRSVSTVPPLMDATRVGGRTPPGRAATPVPTRGMRLLCVGSLLPHKAQHRAVMILAAYRAAYDADAQLTVVGAAPIPAYAQALGRLVEALGLGDAVRLTGAVSDATLANHYAEADVYMSTSDHEGFCIPLVEAAGYGLPVVAYDAGAVAETLDHAGLLLADRSPWHAAAVLHRLAVDRCLQRRLSDAATANLARFDPDAAARQIVEEVGAVVRRSLR
jgi:glycosyltransferase involved in cell wall biosynthesis